MNLAMRFVAAGALTVLGFGVVSRADNSMRGVVVCDGKPVRDAALLATVIIGPGDRNDFTLRQNPWQCREVRAKTDAQGRFALDFGENALSAQGVAAAPEMSAGVLVWINGGGKADDKIELKRVDSFGPDVPVVRGRVVGTDGSPVAGALVTRLATTIGNGAFGGGIQDDQVSITDVDGRFAQVILVPGRRGPGGAKPTGVAWKVSAPDLASTMTGEVPIDDQERMIVLNKGASITGRVERPDSMHGVTRVALDCSSKVRWPKLGETLQVEADAQGRFTFPHIAVGCDLHLYALAWDGRVAGASEPHNIGKLGPSQELDAGVLRLSEGVTISGRVVRDETNAPIGPNHAINLSREDTLLHWRVPIAEDGSFSIANVPTGAKYVLECFDEALMMAPSNPNYHTGHYYALEGLISRARSDIVVRMCVREDPFAKERKTETLPLRGVDPAN